MDCALSLLFLSVCWKFFRWRARKLGKAANIFAYTLTILSAFKANEVFIKLKVLLVVSNKRYSNPFNESQIDREQSASTNEKYGKRKKARDSDFKSFSCYFVFPFAKAINKTVRFEAMTQYSRSRSLSSNPICRELHFPVLNWITLFDDDDELPFNTKNEPTKLHTLFAERANSEWVRTCTSEREWCDVEWKVAYINFI